MSDWTLMRIGRTWRGWWRRCWGLGRRWCVGGGTASRASYGEARSSLGNPQAGSLQTRIIWRSRLRCSRGWSGLYSICGAEMSRFE